MYNIELLQDTLLKSDAVDSSTLKAEDFSPIQKGTLQVDSLHSWGNHYRVTYKGKVGYLFDSHCKVQGTILPYFHKDAKFTSIVKACDALGLPLASQKAYVLATIKHETANTFLPIEEYCGRSQAKKLGYDGGENFFGRGFVQITHRYNYLKYSKVLGIDLVAKPELVLQGDIALFIAIHGFKTGLFTGKKIEDYINSEKKDYVSARRVINGTDKAQPIADLAVKYEGDVKSNFASLIAKASAPASTYKGIAQSKVKLVSQRDNNADRNKDGKNDAFQTCNVHSVKMAIQALTGRDVPIQELDTKVIAWNGSRYSHDNLIRLMSLYGVKSVFSTTTPIVKIQLHFDRGLPIIWSNKLTHGGHITFVAGYDTERGYLIYDPYGEPFGKPGSWTYKDVRKPYYLSDSSFKDSGMNGAGASGHWVHLLSV